MNVDNLLNLEKRTGVKNDDIEDFLRKAGDVEAAIKGLRDGTIDPTEEIKIAGIETPEEIAEKERVRQKRLEEQRRKAEELRLKRKAEEKERWWAGADLFVVNKKNPTDGIVGKDNEQVAATEKERILQRYTMDYSRWNDWEPTDEVSMQEKKALEEAEEKKKNEEFEKNNPEFCNQFLEDMDERNKKQEKKKESAESCRIKGNRYFKQKKWDQALTEYMDSLKHLPYEAKTLMNVAQAYIKKSEYDDAMEFLARVLHLDEEHIKALSRKAYILGERGDVSGAIECVEKAQATKDGFENEDLASQLGDLRLVERERQQEEALQKVLPTPAPTTGTSAWSEAPPLPTAASTGKTKTLSDFEAADQGNVVVSEVCAQLKSALGAPEKKIESFIDSSSHVKTLTDLMRRIEKNDMVRVYVRKSGMLADSVKLLLTFCELAASQEEQKENAAQEREAFVAALLHLVALSVDGERSAKLILVEPLPGDDGASNKLLPCIRDLLARISSPGLVYGAARVLLVCCQDNSCAKARSWVFNDSKLLTALAAAIGELSSKNISPAEMSLGLAASGDSHDKKAVEDIASSKAATQAFLITASDLVKTISFSANGKEHLTKFAHEKDGGASGAVLVCALSSALHFCVMNTLATSLQALFSDAATPRQAGEVAQDSFTKLMEAMKGGKRGNAAAAMAEETCLVVLEALLGCSQVEPFRDHFCLDVPTPTFLSFAHQKGAGGAGEAESSPATMSCVKVVLQTVQAVPGFTSTALAVLMNASLDSTGAVRKEIVNAGGAESALSGLSAVAGADVSALDEAMITMRSRQLGLLSRIAPIAEIQDQLYAPTTYRQVMRAIKIFSGVGSGGPGVPDLLGHLIRLMASLSQPPKALHPIAKEEGVVEALLHIFPQPRTELGKITPESVILAPKEPGSALLLGNAARCLMPLAEDLEGCAKVLYQDRSLAGVEKLVCAMATCSDIRVRRNISIILAKGCRLPDVRRLVTDFRGMQMMIELNKQL